MAAAELAPTPRRDAAALRQMIAGHRRRYRNNAFDAIERLTIDPKTIEQKIRELALH
jgi:DNA-binding NtrC family response regulator